MTSIREAIELHYQNLAEKEAKKILAEKPDSKEAPAHLQSDITLAIRTAVRDVLDKLFTGEQERIPPAKLLNSALRKILGESERASPSIAESNIDLRKRNEELNKCLEVAKDNPQVKNTILALAKDMLNARFPAEMFNFQGMESPKLSPSQINDLTDNFVLWAMEHGLLETEHVLIMYFYIFRGLDAIRTDEVFQRFEKHDFRDEDGKITGSYGLTPELIETYYQESVETLKKSLPTLLDEFLGTVSFNATSDKELTPYYKKISQSRNRYFDRHGTSNKTKENETNEDNPDNEKNEPSSTLPPGVNASLLHFAERRGIKAPPTYLEDELRSLEVCRFQRGDEAARNRYMMTILNYIGSVTFGQFGVYQARTSNASFNDLDDALSSAYLEVLERLPRIDLSKGSGSSLTYISRTTTSAIRDYFRNESLVHSNKYLVKVLRLLAKYGRTNTVDEIALETELPIEVISSVLKSGRDNKFPETFHGIQISPSTREEIFMLHDGATNKEIGEMAKVNPTFVEDLRHAAIINPSNKISLSDPVGRQNSRGENLTFEDIIGEEDDQVEKLMRAQLIEKAIAMLPPNKGQLLRDLFDDKSQAEIANELGLTPGRVSQLVTSVSIDLTKLSEDPENNKKPRKSKHKTLQLNHDRVILVKDMNAFEKWFAEQEEVPQESLEWMKMFLGLSPLNQYRKSSTKYIYDFFPNQDLSFPHSKEEIAETCNILVKRLQRTLSDTDPQKAFIVSLPKCEAYTAASKTFKAALTLFD